MKPVLEALFLGILGSMLLVTTWASLRCPLLGVPRPVATHPWFLATLADAYFGFVTFYVWVAYKQTRWSARIGWLFAILLLGNIAMSLYCLCELMEEPADAAFPEVLTRKRDGAGLLGIALAVMGIAVTAMGALKR